MIHYAVVLREDLVESNARPRGVHDPGAKSCVGISLPGAVRVFADDGDGVDAIGEAVERERCRDWCFSAERRAIDRSAVGDNT